jgi:integrase
MGMIYKRKFKNKDGTVKEGKTYWIKYYRNGKPYRESTRSPKEADAKRLLKKREGEIANGKLPGIYFDRVVFDELAEDFIRDRRINGGPGSVKDGEKRVKHLEKSFDGVKVTSITSDKIQKYVDLRLSEGAANATINRELSALKRMLRLGLKQTPPKVDRVPYISMLKENNVRKGYFKDDAFNKFHELLPEDLQPAVRFLYITGWRRNEVFNLTWGHVDLREGVIRLEPGETKNRQAREFWFDGFSEVRPIFRKQWSNRAIGCKYVFHHNGLPIRDFRTVWNNACRDLGLGYGYKLSKKYVKKWESKLKPGPILHDLRRTAIRHMTSAGVSESVAMEISGHKTNSVFKRYNITNPDDKKTAMKRVEEYLEAQRKEPGSATGTVTGTSGQIMTIEKNA